VNKIIFSTAHVLVYCKLSIQWESFFVSAAICAAIMSSADASILSSSSVLFNKYLQGFYQAKGMYPVTVMQFCVGLSVRNGEKIV
jgi:Na+/proline symporter